MWWPVICLCPFSKVTNPSGRLSVLTVSYSCLYADCGPCINLRGCQEEHADDDDADYDLQLWLGFTISQDHSSCVYCQTSIPRASWWIGNFQTALNYYFLTPGWWILIQTAMLLLSEKLSSHPVSSKLHFSIHCTSSLRSTSWLKNGDMVNI